MATRKPKYQRWPYGRDFSPPNPTPDDFRETMEAIAKAMSTAREELHRLQAMHKRSGDNPYFRALDASGGHELRAAFAWWVVEAKEIMRKRDAAEKKERQRELNGGA